MIYKHSTTTIKTTEMRFIRRMPKGPWIEKKRRIKSLGQPCNYKRKVINIIRTM